MAEEDALSTFDFSRVTKQGIWVKFDPGAPVTLRILTVDPMVTDESYEDKKSGDTIVNTRFSFVVYNFTAQKAQVLKATANTAKKISELHMDPDFGSNIKKIDIKITPPNKGEIKAYEIQVLPNTRQLTNDQIKEAQGIKLEDLLPDGGRLSFYNPDDFKEKEEPKSGYDKAREVADGLRTEEAPDEANNDVGEEPINSDEIPF